MGTVRSKNSYFTENLMQWHSHVNDRTLPWKSEKDPYRIWLSEIILQQTRAQQGLPYYLAFTGRYPTVQDMAAADDQEAFRLWQGLGYYNRCKNMLATARLVVDRHKGQFPATYEGLIGLKGIGPYTASAIASFAFGLSHAVVDGNVYRVLSRYFTIYTPFDTTEGKKQFATLAQELLDHNASSAYNQAIMDLGATVCTPKQPKCEICPLQHKCAAYKEGVVHALPVKSKKITVKKRYFNYLLLEHDGSVWMSKRTDKDIWENLYEPFLIETETPIETIDLSTIPQIKGLNSEQKQVIYNNKLSQRLTHQLIDSRFYSVQLSSRPDIADTNGEWIKYENLKNIPFPKTVVSFLKNNLYF